MSAKEGQGLCPWTPPGTVSLDPNFLRDGVQGHCPWRGLGQSPNLASFLHV